MEACNVPYHHEDSGKFPHPSSRDPARYQGKTPRNAKRKAEKRDYKHKIQTFGARQREWSAIPCLGRKERFWLENTPFYADCGDFLPLSGFFVSALAQKIYKFDKKIIAVNGFDDYYKKFTCKD